MALQQCLVLIKQSLLHHFRTYRSRTLPRSLRSQCSSNIGIIIIKVLISQLLEVWTERWPLSSLGRICPLSTPLLANLILFIIEVSPDESTTQPRPNETVISCCYHKIGWTKVPIRRLEDSRPIHNSQIGSKKSNTKCKEIKMTYLVTTTILSLFWF